jgi:hypothetical protein
MFGLVYSEVFLTNDGVLSFVDPVGNEAQCLGSGTPSIAAYWADADTTIEGTVYYQETDDSLQLCRVSKDVWDKFGELFRPKTLFIVTWLDLAYYSSSGDPPPTPGRNTYQIVLASDGIQSFVYLLYRELGWTTGCEEPSSECGSSTVPPMAGFDAGDGTEPFKLQGSCNAQDAMGILDGSNTGEVGEYLFRVDAGIQAPEARKRNFRLSNHTAA